MTQLHRLANRSRDLLFLPGMDGHWLKRLRGKVMCLLYHRVDEPSHASFLDGFGAPAITPTNLAGELRFLQRRGARFLTFADLRRGEFPGASEFGVIVSFDDGFAGNYTLGLDVLESMNVRGVLFQATAMVDATSLIWEHSLYWHWRDDALAARLTRLVHERLPDSGALRGADLLAYLRDRAAVAMVESLLAEMVTREGSTAALAEQSSRVYPKRAHLQRARAAGHELASHGHHHYPRKSIDGQVFEQELKLSIDVLTRAVGEPPKAFSYPFNSYLPGDKEICARHFEQVATVDGKLIQPDTDRLAMPRFTWVGPQRGFLRRRRWLLTGKI